MAYFLNDRFLESDVHSLELQGNFAIVTRIKEPKFKLKLFLPTMTFELDGKTSNVPKPGDIKKALAFAKSNIIVK